VKTFSSAESEGTNDISGLEHDRSRPLTPRTSSDEKSILMDKRGGLVSVLEDYQWRESLWQSYRDRWKQVGRVSVRVGAVDGIMIKISLF